jgi:hypothetical protein
MKRNRNRAQQRRSNQSRTNYPYFFHGVLQSMETLLSQFLPAVFGLMQLPRGSTEYAEKLLRTLPTPRGW